MSSAYGRPPCGPQPKPVRTGEGPRGLRIQVRVPTSISRDRRGLQVTHEANKAPGCLLPNSAVDREQGSRPQPVYVGIGWFTGTCVLSLDSLGSQGHQMMSGDTLDHQDWEASGRCSELQISSGGGQGCFGSPHKAQDNPTELSAPNNCAMPGKP